MALIRKSGEVCNIGKRVGSGLQQHQRFVDAEFAQVFAKGKVIKVL